VSRFFGRPRRAPLAIAIVLACPLFFAALMASTLAVEHPHIQAEWINHAFWAKKSATHPVVEGKRFLDRSLGPPTARNEALIWLCALVPSLALVVIGTSAAFLRRGGIYISCACGALLALALRIRLDTWTRHHTLRFPYGVDNIRDTSNSNQLNRGEWEHNARETVISIGNVTVILALIIVALYVFGHWRRVRALSHALPPEADVATPALQRHEMP
jgi:hypothetical protein